jgi:lipoprotein-anchoring transpeptidase ErfK/SrfK
MDEQLSRREFLKLLAISLGGIYLPGMWSEVGQAASDMRGRVTRKSIELHSQPDPLSPMLRKLERDEILTLQEEVLSSSGPVENPRWYRLEDGFVHSAYLQRVDAAYASESVSTVPEGGWLAEVVVPYTQTFYKNRAGNWVPLYRLYYQSLHWVMDVVAGPDGSLYYRLADEWLRISYLAPARHLRLLSTEEMEPISPEVPASEKLIEIRLQSQHLAAYEGRRLVFEAPVSSGVRFMETPSGTFFVNRKCPSKHMGDGGITSRLDAYELPGVPWACFFTDNGVALHGAYWHDNFGVRMSQGCVNLRIPDARWLSRWSTPVYGAQVDFSNGRQLLGNGTRVIVR